VIQFSQHLPQMAVVQDQLTQPLAAMADPVVAAAETQTLAVELQHRGKVLTAVTQHRMAERLEQAVVVVNQQSVEQEQTQQAVLAVPVKHHLFLDHQ
jgi:ribosomal protein L9